MLRSAVKEKERRIPQTPARKVETQLPSPSPLKALKFIERSCLSS